MLLTPLAIAHTLSIGGARWRKSGLLRTCDTDGEVILAMASTLTHQDFQRSTEHEPRVFPASPSVSLPTKKESRCPRLGAKIPPDPRGPAKYHRSRQHGLACAFAPHASGRPASDREDNVHDPTIFHPVGCRASLHDAFGEGQVMGQPMATRWLVSPLIDQDFRDDALLFARGHHASATLNHQT